MEKREKLFEQWSILGRMVGDLNYIVQNATNYTEEEIKEWRERAHHCWNTIRELSGETLEHLRNLPQLYDIYTHSGTMCGWVRTSFTSVRLAEFEVSDGNVNLHESGLTAEQVKEVIEHLNNCGFSVEDFNGN